VALVVKYSSLYISGKEDLRRHMTEVTRGEGRDSKRREEEAMERKRQFVSYYIIESEAAERNCVG